jgi:hypothetical protein
LMEILGPFNPGIVGVPPEPTQPVNVKIDKRKRKPRIRGFKFIISSLI